MQSNVVKLQRCNSMSTVVIAKKAKRPPLHAAVTFSRLMVALDLLTLQVCHWMIPPGGGDPAAVSA